MTTDIIVPALGESVTEATVARWFKQPGEAVAQDEPIVELETDKVTLEVNAPASGAIKSIATGEGETVEVGAILGAIEAGAAGSARAPKAEAPTAATPSPQPAAAPAPQPSAPANGAGGHVLSPAAQKLALENNLAPAQIPGTGKGGRITKGDVLDALKGGVTPPAPTFAPAATDDASREKRVKMTKLRQVIAKRLKESQNTAAILTTFNEIDMHNLIALRNQYKEPFEKKYGIKLGFMSFFVKAAVAALKEIPEVNAEIDGDSIVYKNYYHIGVAVGTPQGLVVPVIRDADQKSFADIESEIGALAKKARDGQLSMSELTGGTFTVSNGGVYGSLMSTPILNPPQSGILGMHKTEQRPVAVNGEVVVRPMMYVALSYDHRIIDGRESVTFLVRVKEALEDPARLLLGV